MRIKTNDMVVVLSGRDKGKQGKVMSVDREAGTVTVEGVNRVMKHVRRSQRNMQGGRLTKVMPMPVGKVMLVCPKCSKPTRVGYQFDENAKKVRVCKKCGAVLPETPYVKKR